MAEKRVYKDGKLLNQRTVDMLACAEARLGYEFDLLQGSYNAGGVSASAGTHDGGGAVDLIATDWANKERVLREVGFAAWHREELWRDGKRVWGEHVHAIAIGDPELSDGAETQVHEYYAGQDGLAGHGRDEGPRLDPIPVWPIHFPAFSLTQVRRQFKSKSPQPRQSVRYVQEMLNKRLVLNIKVDGVAGTKTKKAFEQYKTKVGDKSKGYSRATVNKLIAGYYKLKLV